MAELTKKSEKLTSEEQGLSYAQVPKGTVADIMMIYHDSISSWCHDIFIVHASVVVFVFMLGHGEVFVFMFVVS